MVCSDDSGAPPRVGHTCWARDRLAELISLSREVFHRSLHDRLQWPISCFTWPGTTAGSRADPDQSLAGERRFVPGAGRGRQDAYIELSELAPDEPADHREAVPVWPHRVTSSDASSAAYPHLGSTKYIGRVNITF